MRQTDPRTRSRFMSVILMPHTQGPVSLSHIGTLGRISTTEGRAMKLRITLCLIVVLLPATALAQELTVTATNANTVSSKTSIDLPGLTGNPLAIIVATPVGITAQLNKHPVGAWYY